MGSLFCVPIFSPLLFHSCCQSQSTQFFRHVIVLWDVSTMAFTCVVVTINLSLLSACNSINRWHHISTGGSILAWFLFTFLYSGITTPYDRQLMSAFFCLSHPSAYSHVCTSGRLQIPRDSKMALPIQLLNYSGNSQE